MARRATKAKRIDATPPTYEQAMQCEYRLEPITERGQLVGTAYRKRPMIDILHERNILDQSQYKALKHYRHHADLADKSPIRDSLTNWMPKATGGNGPGIELLNAVRVTQDCENAAGQLADILRAVVVNDMSLSRWAMHRHGTVELEYWRSDKNGKRIKVKELRARKEALNMAHVDIVAAAHRVQAELNA